MPTYAYTAVDPQGRRTTGVLSAPNMTQARAELARRRMRPVELREEKRPRAGGGISIPFLGGKIGSKDIALFSRSLATMINSGLSIIGALRILADQTENKRLRGIIAQIRDEVEKGRMLNEVMREVAPDVFGDLYINMVRAGEASGSLDKSLEQLSNFLEKQNMLRAKIRSALMYPTAMISMSLLIVLGIVTFIVPVFQKMFAEMGATLPLPTIIMIKLSGLIRGYWYILLPFCVVVLWAFRRYGRTKGGKMLYDRIKLKIPIFGDLILKGSISRMARTFGTLLGSGVSLIESITIAAETAGNAVVGEALSSARESVERGEMLSTPLSREEVIPPMVTRMISVGEETGSLEPMLLKIADFYEREVETTIEGLISLIEPLLMGFMGILIGGCVVALYMPMFKMITVMGGK
jgi:type IV pilus assembly protein PilC